MPAPASVAVTSARIVPEPAGLNQAVVPATFTWMKLLSGFSTSATEEITGPLLSTTIVRVTGPLVLPAMSKASTVIVYVPSGRAGPGFVSNWQLQLPPPGGVVASVGQ